MLVGRPVQARAQAAAVAEYARLLEEVQVCQENLAEAEVPRNPRDTKRTLRNARRGKKS